MKWTQNLSVPRTFHASIAMSEHLEKIQPFLHLHTLVLGQAGKAPANSHLGQTIDGRLWDALGEFTNAHGFNLMING